MKTTAIVDRFASNPCAATMDEVIAEFRTPTILDEDIAYLALTMADSGERLRHNTKRPIADVPSTGGPSSLSTLLSPLALVIGGATVPKLGVPGRPAGGIDTLATIPDFKAQLSPGEALRCLAASHYVHFLAGDIFAPLDATLFAHRCRIGAINIPSLAIASLLAKKLAVGVNHVTLDVRVAAHANFGSTWDEARTNAYRFIRVAKILAIAATCCLTDATMPYQPYIGRGESLSAMSRIFSGEQSEELITHVNLCVEMANLCLGTNVVAQPAEMQFVFHENLKQQGTSWENFRERVQQVESQPTSILTAVSDGYFYVDLDKLREELVHRQQLVQASSGLFSDPCGLTLLVPCGTFVSKGKALARIRASANLNEILVNVRRCMMQVETPLPRKSPEKLVVTET